MRLRSILALTGAAILSLFSQASAATITWDANAASALQTDGSGDWLTTDQWWNGTSNVTWTSGDSAIFGNGGAGGAVTLGSPTTVDSLTFNSFTGTYTLGTSGQTITLTNGITMNSGAGAVSIISPLTLGAAQSWINNSSGLLTVGTDAVDNGGFLLTIGGSGNTTVSSAIGGLGGLTKSGTGTLTLSGANGYTGTTTINAGTVTLNSSTGSLATTTPLTFEGTGTFNMDNVGASGNLAQILGALTFSAGQGTVQITRTENFDQAITFASLAARTAGASGNFVNTGGTNSGTNGFVIGGLTAGALIDRGIYYNGSSYATYDVGGFVRGFTVGDANYLAAPAGTTIGSSTSTSNVDLTTGNITAQTTVSANTINMRNFNIAMTGTSAVLSTNGLLSSGSAAATIGGGTTPLLQAGSAGGELVIRVNGGSDQLTVSSVIQNNTSASRLTKSGAGTLILSAANTYTGVTAINAGTLQIGNGTTGTINSGSTIVNNGSLVINQATTQTLAAISGSGSVTLTASTGLTLSNSNSYTGGFTLNSGTVALGGNASPYNGFGTGLVTINGGSLSTGATYTFNNNMVWNTQLQLGNSSTLTFNGNITLGANSGWINGNTTQAMNVTINGNVGETGGPRSFTISTGSIAHSLNFNGQNTFTGNIVGHGNTALTVGGTGYLGGGSYAGNITMGSLTYSSSANQILSGIISGSTLNKNTSTASTLTLSGGTANVISGLTTVSAGTLELNKSGAVNAIAAGGLTIGTASNTAATVQYTGASTDMMGAGAVTIRGQGILDFNGKTDTIGAVSIVATGATANSSPIINTAGGGNLTIGTLAITPMDGFTSVINAGTGGTITLGGDVTFTAAGSGQAQITGSALALGGANRTFNIGLGTGAGHDLLIDAGISGVRSLTKAGTGRLVLTGSNSYTLGTTVNTGTLQIGDGTTAGTMATAGPLTMGGGTFVVRGPASGGSSQTVGSLVTTASTGSTITLTPGASGNTTLTITSNTLSTGAGSSLNFNYTAGTTVGGTVGNNYVVWNPTLTGGIIGGAYTVTDSGGTGFATTSGGNVVRLADPGGAGLPDTGGSATGSYFVGSSYSTVSTTTPGSLVLALSGAVAASNVTVDTTGLASGANLALGTNLLTLGAGMVFNGANPYEITGSGAGGLRSASAGGTIYLYNANTNTVTISAPIVNNTASRLTVDGTGTTILSGANTYTGATVLNGGTTRFSGTMAASAVTINNAVAQLGTATGLTSINTVTFGAASTGSLQLLGNSVTIGALSSNATLGTPVITNNNGGGSVANATLTIDSAASTTFGGVIQDGNGGGTLSLAKSGVGTLTLSGINTYSGGTVINAGILSVTADTNLGNASGGITLNGGRLTVAGANISSARSVTVNGTGSLMFVNRNNNFTTSGVLAGSGAISFLDGGGGGGDSLYIFTSSGNTFTGAMTLQDVDVRVSSLGDTLGNNIIFTAAGAFSLNGSGATAGLTFSNRAIELSNSSGTISNLNTTHAITIGSNLVATGAAAKTLTLSAVAGPTNVFSGNITDGSGGGTVALTKTGAGTWVISGANSYTGATTISAGTLSISSIDVVANANALGQSSAVAGNLILNGTLQYTGGAATTDRLFSLQTSSTIDASGSGAVNFNNTGAMGFNGGAAAKTLTLTGANTGNNTIAAVIGDLTAATTLVKNGIGTWVLSGNTNSFTGTTTLNAGKLVLDYAASNTTKLANGAALTLGGGTLELSGGSHTEIVASTTLTNNTGNRITQTNSGTSVLQLGTISRSNGGSSLSFSADNIATTNNTNTNGILGPGYTVGSNWAVNFTNGANGQIRALTSYTTTVPTITGVNTANYQLTGSQTQTGTTTSNTLRIVSDGNDQILNLGNNFNFSLNSANGVMGSLIYAGGGNNNYTINGTGTSTIVPTGGNNHVGLNVFTGTLTVNALLGSGSGTVTKWGVGTLVVGSNNTTSGAHFVQEGTLRLANNGATGTTAGGIVVSNGAALELSNSVAIGAEALTISGYGISNSGALRNVAGNTSSYAGLITLNTATSVGGARINSDTGGILTLTGGVVTSANNNVTFGGAGNTTVSTVAISGAGGLIKDGAGTATLTATNSYTGTTTVSDGTLLVNGSIASSSLTTVVSGATIGGSGTVGALTVSSGGFISGGDSGDNTSIFNINGAYSQAGLYTADIAGMSAGNFDQLNVTGAVNITGGSLTAMFTSGSYTNGDLIFILTNDLSDAIVGTYGGYAQNATVVSYGGFDWSISYTADSVGNSFTGGNDIALMAIPEPKAALLGCLGVLLLLRRRR